MNKDRISTMPKPTSELTNSNRPQVLKVWAIERLKVSFISQKAASLGIVMVLEPAAQANIKSTGSMS